MNKLEIKMFARGARFRTDVLRCALVRHMSDAGEGAARALPTLKIVRATQSGSAPTTGLRPREVRKDQSYAAWQKELGPQLKFLGPDGLKCVVYEAEKRLPHLPEPEFMEAWLQACKPVIESMPPAFWFIVERLGARPDKKFLEAFGVAAAEVQRRRPTYSMFELLEVQQRWGGTRQTMKPFLKEWERAQVANMRNTGFVRAGVASIFADIGHIPSIEFVDEWIRTAAKEMSGLLQEPDAKKFWNLISAAAMMPANDASVMAPVLAAFIKQRLQFGVSENVLVSALACLADCGCHPPAEWIEEICAELLRLLPESHLYDSVLFIRPLSLLATPARDAHAVKPFVRAWAAATQQRALPSRRALVESLASLMRLDMGPSVIGKQWFESWFRAVQSHDNVSYASIVFEGDEEQLLNACCALAARIFDPLAFLGTRAATVSAKRLRMVRQLEDLSAVQVRDTKVLKGWLEAALELGRFRSASVSRVSGWLRALEADDLAERWVKHHAVAPTASKTELHRLADEMDQLWEQQNKDKRVLRAWVDNVKLSGRFRGTVLERMTEYLSGLDAQDMTYELERHHEVQKPLPQT